ncbi:MAG: type II toxin-antitoxin system HicB family antitoxin [Spirochaetaceae bacterium]|nr:type II toxin-antitoxin system HicB family antitoxin [Spirochaetaceae bacterium]
MKNYIALIEVGDKKTAWGVVFPDVPGCFSSGNDYEDTIKNAHEALAFHIRSMKEDGEPIPEPRSLERIKAEWEDWQEWKDNYDFIVASITLLPTYKNEKILISMESDLIARIDRVAKNRSAFIAAAARAALEGKK